jgi:maleylpyruvate isomerase
MRRLYSYFRSSAAFRVRIALALKGLPYETVPIHLLRGGGEHLTASYRALNPSALVPMLEEDGRRIMQSMAIVEYLDERYPAPPLLPPDAADRALVRSIALAVACDIHPLNNLRVLRYLVRELGVAEEGKDRWYRHWVEVGLEQVEAQLAAHAGNRGHGGRFAFGDQPTIADIFIVPQMFNARRFGCRVDHLPTLQRIVDAAMELPAFVAAQPERQPDAE